MNISKEWLQEHLEKLKDPATREEILRTVVTKVFNKGDDVLRNLISDAIPIFTFIAPIAKLLMGEQDSKEVAYMKKEFARVEKRMKKLSEDFEKTRHALDKSEMDSKFADVEINIDNDFRRYIEIFEDPECKEENKSFFMKLFVNNGKGEGLKQLFDGVMGEGFVQRESILEITRAHCGNSRRHMEDFCARLKHLFTMGVIVLLGYAGLEGCGEEQEVLKEWSEKTKAVQEKMTEVIEACINEFPQQAEIDSEQLVGNPEEKLEGLTNQELAARLLEMLKEKYYWVCWFVRVYAKPKQSDKPGLLTKKAYDQCQGKSSFEVKAVDAKFIIRVSYSSSPEPLNKKHIQEQIGKLKGVPGDVAEHLHRELLSGYVVHAFEAKDLGYSSSFADPLQYWGKYNKIYIFIHSV